MNKAYLHAGHWALIMGLLVSITGCDFTNYQRIDEDFKFGYTDRTDYTNVYCGDLPVIPSGCDEAKWDGDIIVARGLRRWHPYAWAPAQPGEGPMCYFIIHKTAYLTNPAAQELSDGFEGPLTQREFEVRDPLPEQTFHNTKFW
jgi:hypothetical protein